MGKRFSPHGVQQPNLTQFDRARHKAILYDECAPETVLNNRQLFQAGSTPVMLGQSPTQQHAYQVFVYAIPMIVCTNVWSFDLDPWLAANCVYIEVDAPLWRDDAAIQDQAWRLLSSMWISDLAPMTFAAASEKSASLWVPGGVSLQGWRQVERIWKEPIDRL